MYAKFNYSKNWALTLRHRLRTMSGTWLAVLLLLPAVASAAPSDFDGDGKSDILWRNTSGAVAIWLMNGATKLSSNSVGSVPTSWTIQGVGDFNGDSKSDIVWRNTSGAVAIWLMNGTTKLSSGSAGTVATDWTIQGVGDFNGDTKSDIVWRHSSGAVVVWLMNGATKLSSGSAGTVATSWTLQGVGDFNGDTKSDIVWRNTSGAVAVWLMNGTSKLSSNSVGSVPTSWTIQGVGDFNGDSKSDIVWRNTSGAVAIWLMNGAAKLSSGSAGSVATEWTIQGVGDFNGDSKSDIVWRHSTGTVVVWLMNGTSKLSSGTAGTVSNAWSIALAPTGEPTCPAGFGCDALAEHNNVRANGPYGPGNPAPSDTTGGALRPLVWSSDAATKAQNWAAQCNFDHSPGGSGFGENIYASAGSTPTAKKAVADSWSSEAADYNYSTNTCAAGKQCGHYTQVVWRNTTAVGCALQACTTNSPFGASFPNWDFVVCNYTPPGNFNGELPY